METIWEQATKRRRLDSSALLFRVMETQRDPGINAFVLDAMDEHIAKLIPLTSTLVTRKNREGLELREVVRRFDPVMAQSVLVILDYPDFVRQLSTVGYTEVRRRFIEKACTYARAQQFHKLYAR